MARSQINPAQRGSGFYIGTIVAATLGSTGNKSVTGLGFKPKLVRFTVIPTASGTVTNNGVGAMTSAAQYYATWFSNSGSSVGRASGTDGCIAYMSNATTIALKAAYVSMDSDGFTINVSSAASSFDVAFEAYA